MTDHIVVFDGAERLIGQTVQVLIGDSSPFTLYGKVLTEEVVGVDEKATHHHDTKPVPSQNRIGLTVL
jgi:tRNA-2-methylthio-N6-dimethylallyladenosine synthase